MRSSKHWQTRIPILVGSSGRCVNTQPVEGDSQFAWKGFDWLWLLSLALICTVFAHAFHIHLLQKLSAYTMNLAISFEPLHGILAAAVLFGEYKQLPPMYFVGLAAILLANVIHPICVRLTRKPVVDSSEIDDRAG